MAWFMSPFIYVDETIRICKEYITKHLIIGKVAKEGKKSIVFRLLPRVESVPSFETMCGIFLPDLYRRDEIDHQDSRH